MVMPFIVGMKINNVSTYKKSESGKNAHFVTSRDIQATKARG